MTIGELIKELQKFDTNSKVYFATDCNTEYKVCEIEGYAKGIYIGLEEIIKKKDRNIIKNVYAEIGDITTSLFMSLETLNKIKRGEYEYPFIQCTDGTSNYYYRLDLLSFISTEEEEYISDDELEKTMWSYIVKKEKFPFKVMVDDNTGF